MHTGRTFLIGAVVLMSAHSAVAQDGKRLVEFSESKARPKGTALGTIFYQPIRFEKELTKGWKENELASNSGDVKSLQSFGSKRVSWFGVVREVTETKDKPETELLVEMKYFDGFTDTHQQIVSIFGAGDFRVVIPGVGHKIEKLSLVRAYGKIEANPGAVPKMGADYVRVWKWGQFGFMAYGEDKSNPEWLKLRKVDPNDIYSSSPADEYYEERLGKR